MKTEYLDLKVDFMFKQLFGQPSRKNITIAFLNDLLGRTGPDKIADLTFENTEYIKETSDGKSVRLDVSVFTTSGERINIEIQLINQHDMPERTLYYWSKMFSYSLNSGGSYLTLPKTIMISILNYPLFPSETDRFHTVFHILENQDHFQWSDRLEFHAFDLSAFMIQWKKYRKTLKEQNKKELPWLMMLAATDYRNKRTNSELFSELEEIAMNEEQVREALIEWETLSADKENRDVYEARMKELRDLLSNFQGERRKGEEIGIEKGIKKGIKKGIEQGMKKGKLEEKNATVKRMLARGLEISLITAITGLSEEEIKNLIE